MKELFNFTIHFSVTKKLNVCYTETFNRFIFDQKIKRLNFNEFESKKEIFLNYFKSNFINIDLTVIFKTRLIMRFFTRDVNEYIVTRYIKEYENNICVDFLLEHIHQFTKYDVLKYEFNFNSKTVKMIIESLTIYFENCIKDENYNDLFLSFYETCVNIKKKYDDSFISPKQIEQVTIAYMKPNGNNFKLDNDYILSDLIKFYDFSECHEFLFYVKKEKIMKEILNSNLNDEYLKRLFNTNFIKELKEYLK